MKTQRVSLGGLWNARSEDGLFDLSVPVPGSLMGALESAGHFGPRGLFFGENNRTSEDIARRDFRFSHEFTLPSAFVEVGAEVNKPRIFLEADGLDTLATLWVNGVEVGKTANMHRRYRFDVSASLREGKNRIEILFSDSISYIQNLQEKRKLWHSYGDMPRYATQGFNRIRKSHCSFGWDWGPIVPDLGVWRSLSLVRYEGARLGTTAVAQRHRDGWVDLDLSVPLEIWGDCSPRVVFSLSSPDGRPVASVTASLSEGRAVAALSVQDPELWWPAGLGEQPLYILSTELFADSEDPLEVKSLELGLRTLTVCQDEDQWGQTFSFAVNGLPFFARGADWIPEDVFLTRTDTSRLERLITDAVKGNFNCLRVWGGGVYPSDEFYALCDRAGLVIWQDLMFACATYDVSDEAFLKNILAEVEDNLERLRHHACLGLVCGNNEMEVAFVEWGMGETPKMRTEYLRQYQFEFPRLVSRVAPDLFYWPASPSSGGDFDNPNDPDRGDTHFWEVWHGNKDFKEYEKHYFRFMSEFGFESFPSLRTIESFTEIEDRNIFSPVMEDHQRCVGGNEKIFNYLAKYFRFPKDFSSVVYLSQLSQEEAIRHGVEHWRRNRGRCMGAVYWQYNDNWPVASWSSVDYYGRWKALHYGARRFFDNVLLSAALDGPTVSLHLSNESRHSVTGDVSWSLTDMAGVPVASGALDARVEPLSSLKLNELDLSSELGSSMQPSISESGATPRERLFFYRFNGRSSGGSLIALDGCVPFVPYKSLSLRPANLSLSAELDGQGGTLVTVNSDLPALFVELCGSDRDLLFSDNFFHLDGRHSKTVRVERGDLKPSELSTVIRARSLRESYE